MPFGEAGRADHRDARASASASIAAVGPSYRAPTRAWRSSLGIMISIPLNNGGRLTLSRGSGGGNIILNDVGFRFRFGFGFGFGSELEVEVEVEVSWETLALALALALALDSHGGSGLICWATRSAKASVACGVD